MVPKMRPTSNGENRPASSSGSPMVIKRWDGASRLCAEWDQLRRDPELWIASAECIVHLGPPGHSRRGPSFRVPLVALRGTVLATQARPVDLTKQQPWDTEGSFARLQRRLSHHGEEHNLSELFLPAPEGGSRDQIVDWHLATRNYFAFVLKKALVGRTLGRSLIDLQKRLDLWRPNHRNNLDDLLAYARQVGYMAFAHCPDYALAMLAIAERNRIDDLWVDAFAHCVGMEDMLSISDEHENVSRATKANITNYAISMTGRLLRATKSLSCFLEDDFSPAYLGISDAARGHLNDFQQFLRDFYAQKFGTWPPRTLFSKSIFKSMYSDFSNLYDYLVDLDSTVELSEQGLASGGICVLQTVQDFDKRNTYKALPNPLCHLPDAGKIRRSSSKKALVALGLGDRPEVDPIDNVMTRAANTSNVRVLNSPLVKAFQMFESLSLEEQHDKLTLLDGRKIRWLLVYCTLQVLATVMEAPMAVCDTDTNYPLCCDTQGIPPWNVQPELPEGSSRPKSSGRELRSPLSINNILQGGAAPRQGDTRPHSKGSKAHQSNISPDCQQDDYIRHIEIPIPTWKDVLSMRDPSTVAIKKMKKQMDSDPNQKQIKQKQTAESSKKKSSRYSFNMLGSRKSVKDMKRKETDAREQVPQVSNTTVAPSAPTASEVARQQSSSTGRSSHRSHRTNRSDSKSRRVDSKRTSPSTGSANLARSPSSDLLNKVLAGQASASTSAAPKSPTRPEVAPWEAMEPTMSGAIGPSAPSSSPQSTPKPDTRSDHKKEEVIPIRTHKSSMSRTLVTTVAATTPVIVATKGAESADEIDSNEDGDGEGDAQDDQQVQKSGQQRRAKSTHLKPEKPGIRSSTNVVASERQ